MEDLKKKEDKKEEVEEVLNMYSKLKDKDKEKIFYVMQGMKLAKEAV